MGKKVTQPYCKDVPEEFTEAYTKEDKALVVEIINWLNTHSVPQSRMAQKARVDQGTLNRILSGNYPSPPSKQLLQVIEAIRIEDRRASVQLDVPRVVETRLFSLIRSAAHRSRTLRKLSCITASPGTGKSTAIQHYVSEHPDTLLVDTVPGMHVVSFLEELVEQADAKSIVQRSSGARTGTRDQMARALVKKLRGTNTLLAIDEAESCTPSTIEYFRKICDQAGIGGLLIGDDQLFSNLHNSTRQHDKTRSRFCMFPDTVRSLNRDENDQLARVYLSECDDELTADVLTALWECSAGSARVLCDTLITAVRDFGLAQGHKLTPALVHHINNTVLNYTDRTQIERSARLQHQQKEARS